MLNGRRCSVGVVVAGLGALEVAGGETLVAIGGISLIQEAMGDCSIEIMEHRGTSDGSGGGEYVSKGSSAGPGQHVVPQSELERYALDSVKSKPWDGLKMELRKGRLEDERWSWKDGWVKKYKIFEDGADSAEVHWVYNERTGWADDFKFQEPTGYMS